MEVVIALGGNAILRKEEKASVAGQFNNTYRAMENILPIIKKYHTVITHGNAPQVGAIMLRVESALGKTYSLPLYSAVAESEGEMGFMIEQSLQNSFMKHRIKKFVASLLTQVLVDKKDKGFKNPTKPIGPFYEKKKALFLEKKGFRMKKVDGGYRRVVASPRPLKIIEAGVIKELIKHNIVVIAAGGGGIPVYKEKSSLRGIDAVIDKDLASSCLAKSISAKYMFILTGVDKVYLDYGKKNQKGLKKISVSEAKRYLKEGHFPAGSMGPKIEASIDFLINGGKKVIITSPEKIRQALSGREGTHIS